MKKTMIMFLAMTVLAVLLVLPAGARMTITNGNGLNGRNHLATDLSLSELEQVVGRGFISRLTPEEISDINARGLLPSPEAIRAITRDLLDTTIKGIRIVIDKSKFTNRELADVLAGWERELAGM
ncbi:hypothetical protein [Desulfosudis oleivorans]|uniref:Uncharacterized protein n=1 Tax=Desulfosudis oleivorans (strain DSM 6200 / JCM 39069 / Hxd3) TaxID=96561 RepID=A8ZZZ1_DESOH|nr:hypothetical protein [Desulfosudis oleivorans]ABW67391.1 hypothetical protein Dole_1587 [Desulfosudis oleivorans Hxd3]